MTALMDRSNFPARGHALALAASPAHDGRKCLFEPASLSFKSYHCEAALQPVQNDMSWTLDLRSSYFCFEKADFKKEFQPCVPATT